MVWLTTYGQYSPSVQVWRISSRCRCSTTVSSLGIGGRVVTLRVPTYVCVSRQVDTLELVRTSEQLSPPGSCRCACLPCHQTPLAQQRVRTSVSCQRTYGARQVKHVVWRGCACYVHSSAFALSDIDKPRTSLCHVCRIHSQGILRPHLVEEAFGAGEQLSSILAYPSYVYAYIRTDVGSGETLSRRRSMPASS